MNSDKSSRRRHDRRRNPHPYLSGNFAPIKRTLPLTPCVFEGAIPSDLAGGQYVRNGGNPVSNEDLGRDCHWFDGDGMLSGVLFRRRAGAGAGTEAGAGEKSTKIEIVPEFVNQFLLTDVYCAAVSTSSFSSTVPSSPLTRLLSSLSFSSSLANPAKPILPSITTLVNPLASVLTIIAVVLRTIFIVVFSHISGGRRYPIKKISVANTGVVYHDGRALATCESGPPLRFALPELQTIGWYNGHRTEENEPLEKEEVAPGETTTTTAAAAAAVLGGNGLLSFMKEWTTAHPRVDPVTHEFIAFHSVFLKPFVRYSIIPASAHLHSHSSSTSRSSSSLNLPIPGVTSPKMMHDFGVSRHHTVILDLPLSFDPFNLARGKPVLSYDAAATSRFGVFPRREPDKIRWFETAACVIFHTANCWSEEKEEEEEDGEEEEGKTTAVHLLACRLTSASLVFSAGNLPTPALPAVPPEYAEEEQCRLYYYNFPFPSHANGGDLDIGRRLPPTIKHQWALSAIPFEFPTINPAVSMRAARFVYGCTTREGSSYTAALGKAAKIDVLAKIDVRQLIERGMQRPPRAVRGCVDERTVREVLADDQERKKRKQISAAAAAADPIQLFTLPPGFYAQEPRFVPRRQHKDEDDGYLLTYVFDEGSHLDPATGECLPSAASELWIIDAKSMQDVLAKIKLPQRVPYGLHGQWFSEGEVLGQRPFVGVRSVENE